MPAGEALNVLDLIQGNWGWLITIIVFGYEFLWPYWTTKLQGKIEKFVEDIYDELSAVRSRVDRIDENLTHHIQVTRAMSREMEGIDDEKVDKYLVKNGVQVDEFIKDKEDDE